MFIAETAPAVIRVFVASPEDVMPERTGLARVIQHLNHTYEKSRVPVRWELKRWETHSYPAPGRAQKNITEQIGEYDVFVGLMWRRFGTPSGKADSGTEEEYRRAYRSWKRLREPHIMFYFSAAPAPPPKTLEDAEQLYKVVRFRSEIREQNLIAEYDGPADFENVIRPHLDDLLEVFLDRLDEQQQRRDRVISQGRRGMFDAVSMATARPRKANGPGGAEKPLGRKQKKAVKDFIRATPKEEGPWRNPPRSPRRKPSHRSR